MYLLYAMSELTDEGIASKHDFLGVFHTEEQAEKVKAILEKAILEKEYVEKYPWVGFAVAEVPRAYVPISEQDYEELAEDLEYDFSFHQYDGVEVPIAVKDAIINLCGRTPWHWVSLEKENNKE